MLLFARLLAAVWLCASVPATAHVAGTSQPPIIERVDTGLGVPVRDALGSVASEQLKDRDWQAVVAPVRDGQQPFPVVQDGPSTSVPLPTGLSLFGAAVLTLGILGLMSGSNRRAVLETGWESSFDTDSREAAATVRFRIEVAGEHGAEMRHTRSARAAIDLIADLLNDGWDLVRICDRDGLSVDYEQVILACRHERNGH